ncbi:hypothetical protein MXMO3_01658 [Maritalea myrionectae]|uniref:Uncharacterized protein n=1 Tax=Maritalea myrionectae TaxID=454601 RepID=A0A2R4ME35_9HYPH|nr:hypothetical protein [Maritalea myrionectae]AVX04184.1 hypothetical protein MXMO3_01658 [Maritalea myrionectae]
MSRTASFTDADGKRAIRLAKEAKAAGLPVSGFIVGVKECRILLADELDAAANQDKNRGPKEWPKE